VKIIIGAPVKGFRLKESIKVYLSKRGHEMIDVGCYATDQFVKYPSIAERVAFALQNNQGELAINICGSGTGAAIGVDKFSGVLACACESVKTATLARVVNGANCLCLGEDIVTEELGSEIADAFVNAVFLDNPNASQEIRTFWKEAHDEMKVRGVKASVREIEYL
jgi:ribose 5-phosphate isomerase B